VLDVIADNSIDLIYIDPPFYSQRYYETFWGEDTERFAFEDRWKGGIQTYLNYVTERLRKLHTKLKPNGSMYVHLDWHIGHYIKVELDKLFGYHNFLNEIIWAYESGGRANCHFHRKHDVLFLYSKAAQKKGYTFNGDAIAIPRNKCDSCGTVLSKWNNLKKNVDSDGRIYRTIKSAGKTYKYYDDEPVTPSDVWHISHLQQKDPERLGYPTQKPLALLDRIIRASSNPGDLVLDSFCGCGTAMEAAQRLGRRWIGIDISQQAVRVVQNRLRKIGAAVTEVHGMVDNEKHLHDLDWREFQTWAVDAVQGRHSPRKIADMGIDGFTFMEHHPIQVKQADAVGRPVIDNFVGVLEREKDKRGLIIAFDFTKGAEAEVARLKREQNIEIELITCKRLIREEIPYKKLA
jgi:DNA modification methylase